MAEFKPITTQEELDTIIETRLKRERETIEKRFGNLEDNKAKAEKYDRIANEDYEGKINKLQNDLTAANEKIDGHSALVNELTRKAAVAESALLKAKIANEYKLPFELSGRLSGETEDEIRADAQNLAPFIAKKTGMPLASSEPIVSDSKEAAYKELLQSIEGE